MLISLETCLYKLLNKANKKSWDFWKLLSEKIREHSEMNSSQTTEQVK